MPGAIVAPVRDTHIYTATMATAVGEGREEERERVVWLFLKGAEVWADVAGVESREETVISVRGG